MEKKHSNGSNLIHHIDSVGSFDNITGNILRIVYFPENYEEVENYFALLTSRVINEYGDKAKQWFTQMSLDRHNSDVKYDPQM